MLREIGADHIPQILVWNKIDAAGLEPAVERDEYAKISRVFISAQSGAGLDLLREAIVEAARAAPGRSHLFDEQDSIADDDLADADMDERASTSSSTSTLAEPR